MVIREVHAETLRTGFEYWYSIYNIQVDFNCEYYYNNIKVGFNLVLL